MTKPRHTYTPEQLLANVAHSLGGIYAERGNDGAVRDVRALFELCQQQRLLIEWWEEVCHVKCPGTREIAEVVRNLEDGKEEAK